MAASEPAATAKAEERTGAIEVDRAQAGAMAPIARFNGPNGAPARLVEFRGKPVLVNLWATWCGPCVKELPTLDRLAAREGDALQVVTVSQDSDGDDGTARAKVDRFFAEKGYRNLRPFVDAENAMMTELGIGTLPTSILYDAQGREVWRYVGDAEWDGTAAAALLREARPG